MIEGLLDENRVRSAVDFLRRKGDATAIVLVGNVLDVIRVQDKPIVSSGGQFEKQGAILFWYRCCIN